MIIIFLVSMALILIFFLFKERKDPRVQLCLPPGPKPWPFLGNLLMLIKHKPVFRQMHDIMSKMGVEICCFRLGETNVIVVSSPEVACEFLRKHDAIFASRPDFLSAELVSGGFSATALTPLCDQWRKMRHIFVAKIFSPTSLQLMHDKRVEEADNIVHYVGNVIKNNEGKVNVRVVTRHFCANVIRKMVFNKRFFGKGTENGGPGVQEEEHVDMIFTIQKYLYAFCISDYIPFLRRRLDLDGHEKATKHALANVMKYHDPEIDSRIKQWKDGTRSQKQDFLDILITLEDEKCKSLLTPDEIKAQVLDIMLGIDNPSNAVEWALGELINQPELLEKATNELDRVVGKKRLVQESDIPNLNYIKACLKESLRLHPVAPFNLPHVSISNTTVSGYFIPKGSHILLSRPGLGRNPRIWDEPLRFIPERHLKDEDSQVNLSDPNLHVFSFSVGKRRCAGIHLGSILPIILLARLLQAFTWHPMPNTDCVQLLESRDNMFMSKPLHAFAVSRLTKYNHI